MPQTKRDKVFISFHHEDQKYKERFAKMMKGDIVDKSVKDKDIDDRNTKTAAIRRKIRDDFIADATVTVVLIGPCTWQRKHVDWEIGSSLRKTKKNPRCGLLGILLPNHPNSRSRTFNPLLIPPRLADNCKGDDPYACIYRWSGNPNEVNRVRRWIHQAFAIRDGISPNNSHRPFRDNWSGDCSKGWQN